jgi:hypothetical protein
MFFRICSVVIFGWLVLGGPARAQAGSLIKPTDPRGEFVRLCVAQMAGRWRRPESVCGCLHDYAAAAVDDADLRSALLRGISETGVPTIETEWVPAAKRSEIAATFTKVARPALQCMFEPSK